MSRRSQLEGCGIFPCAFAEKWLSCLCREGEGGAAGAVCKVIGEAAKDSECGNWRSKAIKRNAWSAHSKSSHAFFVSVYTLHQTMRVFGANGCKNRVPCKGTGTAAYKNDLSMPDQPYRFAYILSRNSRKPLRIGVFCSSPLYQT